MGIKKNCTTKFRGQRCNEQRAIDHRRSICAAHSGIPRSANFYLLFPVFHEGLYIGFILSIALYIIVQLIFPKKISKFLSFLGEDIYACNYVKKTRRQILDIVFFFFAVIFFLMLFSFGALTYILISVWLAIGVIFYKFVLVWRFHGYSVPVLVTGTAVAAALSFFITLPAKGWIVDFLHSIAGK